MKKLKRTPKGDRMTQRKLSRILDIPTSSLCEIIHGNRRPSLEAAAKLEKRSGISRLTWLYGTPTQIRREVAATYGQLSFHRNRKQTKRGDA